jgi:phosphatidylserine/phosphatidylglycerophosphate/cardiolipin synthase-like enzyme
MGDEAMKRSKYLGLPLLAALSMGASAPMTSSQIQLVQSVPVETSLAQPDLPYAKDVWVSMIQRAKKSIDLAQFYLSAQKGEALDSVIEELEKAGKRGVRIRLLVSNALLKEYPETFDRLKSAAGVSARIMDISKQTGGILHAKYWIIDGKEVYVGSQNFDWRALTQIHETGALFAHPKVTAQLQKIFDADWKLSEKPGAPLVRPQVLKAKAALVQDGAQDEIELVASPPQLNPPGIRSAEEALLTLLNKAKGRLQVQLLEYSPVEDGKFWPALDNALRDAAVRGVKVQLLVSDWNKKPPKIDHLKSLALVPGIEVKIATIPKWSGGDIPFARVIHSKYMIVDSQVLWMGTSNWSEDYFRHSRNVELIFRRPELAAKVDQIFAKLWNSDYVKAVN